MKFGTYIFPHVLQILHDQPREQVELPISEARTAYRDDVGGRGARFMVRGEIRPASQQTRDQMIALADGTPRILDLEEVTLAVLEACLRFQTGPVWTDNTAESQSAGGTPFTLLGASSDYLYFGHREKFNKLQFTLQTLGSYGARTWEYAKGDGTWAAITPGTDSTNGFSQNGTVSISPASDWKTDTVNAIGGKYWLRVKVASLTFAATVLQIRVNVVFNCLMFDPHFEESADLYDRQPYSCVFVQKEDPS